MKNKTIPPYMDYDISPAAEKNNVDETSNKIKTALDEVKSAIEKHDSIAFWQATIKDGLWDGEYTVRENIKTIMEALEKQMPKAIKNGYCPTCGEELYGADVTLYYCWNCGQKLE